MRRKFIGQSLKQSTAALSLLILTGLPQAVFSQYESGATKYFRRSVQNVRTEFNVPALAGVLIVDGKIVVAGANGYRKQGSGIQVTDNDKFPIGSVSKTFTAFIAARLTQKNSILQIPKLTWETKIKDVFPELVGMDGIQEEYLDKTLGELTTHQAGLPRNPLQDSEISFEECDKTDFNEYMKCGRNQYMFENLKQDPIPSQDYSNIGPVIVANMAQEKTGKTWEELIASHIYNPLGLNAGFVSSYDPNTINDPQFHEENGLLNNFVPYSEYDKYNTGAPSGHVAISAKDLGKFLIELMPNAGDRVGVLKDATLQQYLERYNSNRDVTRGGWAILPNTNENNIMFGLNEKILWRNGSHGKNYTSAFLLPDAQVGFAAMTNIAGDDERGLRAVDRLNEHFKRMWYNKNVLPFFAQSSSANITASGTSIDLAKKLANVNDLNMLTSWKANAANSSLTLSTGSPLTSINGLVLVYPRGTHNIKKIRIYAVNPSTNSETLINTLNEVGDDNSIFEIEGELLTSKIRVEFESTAGKTAEVAEALLIYDDPFKIFKQKLSQIKAIDKVKIQPPPVFGNRIGKQR